MLQHSRTSSGAKEPQISMRYAMNTCDSPIMAFVQKIKHSMQNLKQILIKHWKNKYYSAGYWKGAFEFDQQCFLCSGRKKETARQTQTGLRMNQHVSVSTKKIE